MSIFLKASLETEIVGHGDGFISIRQIAANGEESVIWLTVDQFETIWNHQKHIIREAVGSE